MSHKRHPKLFHLYFSMLYHLLFQVSKSDAKFFRERTDCLDKIKYFLQINEIKIVYAFFV